MINRRFALLAAAAALVAAPASAQTLLERFAGTGAGATTFVQMVTISDNFEIESSRYLLSRSQHPQIRQFAQMMVEHHTMTSRELQAIPDAATRVPAQLDERRTGLLLALRNTDNEDLLNRTYVQQQVDSHEEAVMVFETYANGGEVPSLRTFAQRHLPLIRQHLEMARALQAPRAQ